MRVRVVSWCCVGLFLSVSACGQDPSPQAPPLIIIEPGEDMAGAPDQLSAPDLEQAPDQAQLPDLEQAPDMAPDMASPPDMEAPDMEAPDMEAPDMAPDPCASFQSPALIKPNCGPAPLRVRFDASGVLDGFEDIRDYYWELSDGSIVREVAFDATYRQPGETEEVFHFLVVVSGTRIDGSIDAKVRVLP